MQGGGAPFFYTKFYIMYYNFPDNGSSIDFGQKGQELHIICTPDERHPNETYSYFLSKEDLFELIGALLRIQSKIKEVNNGI